MGITGKELAEKLNISATAVSMALNGKPGVSTEMRKRIIAEAEKAGYDFSRLQLKKNHSGDIYCIIYRAHNAILNYTPIFSELTEGIEAECRHKGYGLKTLQVYENTDDLTQVVEELRVCGCVGIILLGTELSAAVAFSKHPCLWCFWTPVSMPSTVAASLSTTCRGLTLPPAI